MSKQHTPGPWQHNATKPFTDIAGKSHDGLARAVWAGDVPICTTAFSVGKYGEQPPEVNDANARLIAAAPELLNYLCGVMEHIERGELMVCDMASRQNQEATAYMLGEIKAAIAKAKGVS